MTIIRMRTTGAWLGAFALCGCATTASPPSKTIAEAANCTEHAAGRNTLANSPCGTPGERSYSQTDLRNTGEEMVGDALALLDPALTVRH